MMPSPAFGMGASAQRPFVTWGLGNLSRVFAAYTGIAELISRSWAGELRVEARP